MNHLAYKDYHGSIEYSKEDKLLYGKVLGTKTLISYEGKTGAELAKDFQEAIEIYLFDCEENGIEPEKAFKGSFNVRVSSQLHREIALQAKEARTSLNSYINDILTEKVGLFKTGLPLVKSERNLGKKSIKKDGKSLKKDAKRTIKPKSKKRRL